MTAFPIGTKTANPVARVMRAVFEAVYGRVDTTAFPGSNNVIHFDCPYVLSGRGDPAHCHASRTYVSLTQIEDAVQINIRAILGMQNTAKDF